MNAIDTFVEGFSRVEPIVRSVVVGPAKARIS